MYESMNCPIPDVTAYLARIGMNKAPATDSDGLNALIWQHQTHVPFEDLNTSRLKKPVSLEIPALFDKIVAKRRGGYCYELNALFCRLLLDLSFDACPVFCRVVRGRDFLPPCAHEAIVVTTGKKRWFCDVGFGGPMPAAALPIEDGTVTDCRGERFRMDRFDPYWWTISRQTSAGPWEAVLQFNTFPQLPQEFLAANMKSAMDPESLFVRHLLVNLRTNGGALSITDGCFTIRDRAGQSTEAIPDDAALERILRDHFGIEVDFS